ncbi:ANTAR domain-containing protein [Nocardioides sp.]|uniref:ANTAR domain-containing protein n=1 Tax=Nocardioides sp. TaxID=35761 RepID=UPI003443AF3F
MTNADLSFSTREVARQAPQKLRDGAVIQVAVGIIAASGDLSMDEARYALREAARRAGTSEVGLARTVVATVNEYGND